MSYPPSLARTQDEGGATSTVEDEDAGPKGEPAASGAGDFRR